MAETEKGEISSLDQKIIQQIEYYFGDLNLPRDKFLQAEVKKEDGWVSLETLLKFNRLKSLSTDGAVIAAAVRKSDHGVVEVDKEGTKIRRLKPLPENSMEYWHEVKSRTVYVKRFPEKITLDELQEFFKKFGEIERVVMRCYKSEQQRNFKGSVFVTFPSKDEAKKFVDIESVKYGDDELVRLLQEQYFKEKNEESKRKRGEQKAHRNGAKPKTEPEPVRFTAGRVIRLTGLPKEGVVIDDIRSLFSKQQKPEWVEYNKGDEQAYVRFENKQNSAEDILKSVLEASGGKLSLADSELTTEVIAGDDEQQYWERTIKAIKDAREQNSGGGGGRGGRGRGGRGRGRGGGRGRGRGRGRGGRGGRRGRDEDEGDEEEGDDEKPKNRKKRFSSSSESEAEEKAAKEHRNAKRPAAAANEKEPTEGGTAKKAKTEDAAQ